MALIFTACDKDEDFEFIPHKTVLEDIDSLGLSTNHVMIVADGVSELNMELTMHQFYMVENFAGVPEQRSHILVKSRLKPGDIKYFYEYEGEPAVEMESSTYIADATNDAEKVLLFANVLGQETEKIEIQIKKPVFNTELLTEKSIPVIFHLFESSELNDTDFKLKHAHILKKFEDINIAYLRLANKSPNGFNTKIKFVPAEYSPAGVKLKYAGMNVISLQSEFVEEEYYRMSGSPIFDLNNFADLTNTVWDYQKYFNVWVMNSKFGLRHNFSPKHVVTGQNTLQGIDMLEVNEGDAINYKALDVGAVMEYGKFIETSFAKTAGTWLGLLDTGYRGWGPPPMMDPDYCDDTFVYPISREGRWPEKTNVETGVKYLSNNIMDERSKANTITFEQGKRVLHVANYCPTRMCWKAQ